MSPTRGHADRGADGRTGPSSEAPGAIGGAAERGRSALALRSVARSLAAPVLHRLDRIQERLDRLEQIAARADRMDALAGRADQRTDRLWGSKAVQVGDRVLIGCRHLGLAYFFPADDLLLMPQFLVHGEYESSTTAFLMRTLQPDSVCIDVGANVGYYACLMARCSSRGRTIAFEADPVVHAILRDNVSINWCEAVVDARNQAVGAAPGSLTLYRRIGRSGNTSIAQVSDEQLAALGEAESVPFEVECVRLDDVAADLDRLDVVKIDVEGAESLVLDGMADVVDRLNPLIIMEWSPGQAVQAGSSTDDLADRIEALGLTVHVFEPDGALRAVDADDLRTLGYQNVALRRV